MFADKENILPDGLTQDMMPKYINYHKGLFRIKNHPNQTTKYIYSKPFTELTMLEKLEEIKEVLHNLNAGSGDVYYLNDDELKEAIGKNGTLSLEMDSHRIPADEFWRRVGIPTPSYLTERE